MVEKADYTLTLADLKRDLAMDDGGADDWGTVMGALYPACEELYCRAYEEDSVTPAQSVAIDRFLDEEAKFRTGHTIDRAYLTREAGRDPADPQDGGNYWAANAADSSTSALLAFARYLHCKAERIKAKGEDY